MLKFPRAESIKMIQQLAEKYVNIKSFHLALDAMPGQIRQMGKKFEDAGLTIVSCGTIVFSPALFLPGAAALSPSLPRGVK